MLRGFYTAASGMIAQQRNTELLSNNMANVRTPGFKADQASLRAFPQMLMQRLDNTEVPSGNKHYYAKQLGGLNTGVYMQETIPIFTQGSLQSTNNNTDLALVDTVMPVNANGVRGTVLFEVQNANGEPRYTRNGNFTLDAQGFLTTNQGYLVQSTTGQPIQIPTSNFQVHSDGTIYLEGAENPFAQINIVYSENPRDLIKEGNGLFALQNGQLPTAIGNPNLRFDVKQGYIEASNVDLTQTMTEMMTAYRSFEANQKVLKAYDESMGKAVNEIGRIG